MYGTIRTGFSVLHELQNECHTFPVKKLHLCTYNILLVIHNIWNVCSGNLAVFTVLCEQYQLALQRDPTYAEVSCRR